VDTKTRRSRRTQFVLVVIVLACLAGPAVLVLGVMLGGTGSPRKAEQLRASLQDIPDPGTARSQLGDTVETKTFANGTWVVGVGVDSHLWMGAYRGGGTVVLKDSRGRVRAFFGHVCGPRGLRFYVEDAQSLEELYERLYREFTEYSFPEDPPHGGG